MPDPDQMEPHVIMADATPGVLYNKDIRSDSGYSLDRLWISLDHGKTWELRDDSKDQCGYVVSNIPGIIYRAGLNGIFKSLDYGQTFIKMEEPQRPGQEPGLNYCEFFSITNRELHHTNDCHQNYVILSINEISPYLFTDVCRGALQGEVYITAAYPGAVYYTIFFSADTGYTFRKVLTSRLGEFMSDRKAGDFHLSMQLPIYPDPNSGSFYYQICIAHYTDYGETFVGRWCHELEKRFPQTHCLGVMDLHAEVQGGNNVALIWGIPDYDQPVSCFRIYRNGEFLKEVQGIFYLDENLPNGSYIYHVRVVYADGCETLSYNTATVTIETEGIEPVAETEGIVVYPNPTNGELKIENGELEIINVEIFDIFGRVVGAYPCGRPERTTPPFGHPSNNGGEFTLDISNAPSGIYFIRIQTENDVVTRKIVKQ